MFASPPPSANLALVQRHLAPGMDPGRAESLRSLAFQPAWEDDELAIAMSERVHSFVPPMPLHKGDVALMRSHASAHVMGEWSAAQARVARAAARAAGKAVQMSLAPSAVHIDTAISNFLIMYQNRTYIADSVLPVVQVSKRSDKIFVFPVETMQTLAKTQISSFRARPGELAYSVKPDISYLVQDYGLVDFVSADEESAADAPLQPRLAATQVLTNALLLAREYRVANNVVFATASYGTSTSALTAGARWDQATSSPVGNILSAIMNVLEPVNTFVIGEQAWVPLRNNAELKSYVVSRAATGLGATPAIVDQDFFAKAFGLDSVYVGRAKYNSANEGSNAVNSQWVWGKSAALIRVEPQPNARMTQCFGYTLRYQSKAFLNQVIPELLAGVRGGNWIKITHSDIELPLIGSAGASPAGYLYTTVVS